MSKRSLLAAALAAVTAVLALVVVRPAPSAAAAAVRIMPLGDSITGSPGCWRATLWNRLQSTGHTDVDFVGTLPPQGCGVTYDGDNEGHGGILATNPSQCSECGARAVALNNAIPGWASARSTAQSPIIVVDQWTGFNTATDTYDGVHPNANGDQKMSDRWYPALTSVLNGVIPTAGPTPSTPPTSTGPAPTTPAPGACGASYAITGQWQGGRQGEVTVRNTGTAQLSGWVVRWTFANGQQVSQSWNGTVTQSGSAGHRAPGGLERYRCGRRHGCLRLHRQLERRQRHPRGDLLAQLTSAGWTRLSRRASSSRHLSHP